MSARPDDPVSAHRVKFDLNCDLGEGEKRTAALMRRISSANIACGGHAGDVDSMRATVRLALDHGVHIGAHPGLCDPENFGRRELPISVAEFRTLLLQQVSALERIVRDAGAKLHHIKLHGALYHMVESQASLRRAYLETVREFWPVAIIFSLAGGSVAHAAARLNLRCWGEGFLDRSYDDATHLTPRDQVGSVLSKREFLQRIESLVRTGEVLTKTGLVNLAAQTWCIHSDHPRATSYAAHAAQAFFPEQRRS